MMHSMTLGLAIYAAALLPGGAGYCAAGCHTLLPARSAVGRTWPVLALRDDDRDDKTKEEDDALAAAFAARLKDEGGATQFKIKSSLNDAADTVKGAAGSAKNVATDAKDAAASGVQGLMKADGFQIVAGLLVTTVFFTLVAAAGRSSVDMSTSDGTKLEFGQRSMRPDPYRPEFGYQSE